MYNTLGFSNKIKGHIRSGQVMSMPAHKYFSRSTLLCSIVAVDPFRMGRKVFRYKPINPNDDQDEANNNPRDFQLFQDDQQQQQEEQEEESHQQ